MPHLPRSKSSPGIDMVPELDPVTNDMSLQIPRIMAKYLKSFRGVCKILEIVSLLLNICCF